MNPLDAFLPAPHTVLFLANVALAALLSCAAALLAASACRRRSAPTCYGLLLLGLVLALTSPALVWIAGRAGIGRLQVALRQNRDAGEVRPVVQENQPRSVAVPRQPQVPDTPTVRNSLASEPDREVESQAVPPVEPTPRTAALPWWCPLAQGLALIWAVGTVVSLARLLCGSIRLAAFCRGLRPVGWDSVPTNSKHGPKLRSGRSGQSPNLLSVRHAAAQAAAQVGLFRRPRLFVSAQTATPVTFGLFRPAVALPEGCADGLPSDQLHALLLHEMAHVARHDPWVGLAQRLAAALYWWCPLVHWLNRRLGDVREELCDNYVLGSQGDGASLAEVLVSLAERVVQSSSLPATVGMFEHRPARERSRALEQRVRRLLSTETNPMTHMNRAGLALVLLVGLPMTVMISLSHVRAAGEGAATAESGPAGSPAYRPAANTPAQPKQTPGASAPDSGPAEVIAEIEGLGGGVTRDEGRPDKPVTEVVLHGNRCTDALLERLKVFGDLQMLVLFETRVTDAGLLHLKSLRQLQTVIVSWSPVSNAFLDRLQELPQLRSLRLNATEVGNDGLQRLARLSQLKSLALWRNPVSDSGIAHLAQMPQLEELNLDGTRVSDVGLQTLRGLPRLQRLNLQDTRVTDAGLKELGELTQLRDLGLEHTQVTDAGLKQLSKLTQLTRLNLRGTAVTDAGLEELATLTQLQDLSLSAKGITDVGLGHLAGLTRMVSLDLSGTKIADAGLAHLQRMAQLQTLNLSGTKVTEVGLKHLHGLTTLQKLDLRGTGIRLSDTGLVHLQGLRKLQGLDLRGAAVTDAGLRHLRGLTELQRLDLSDTQITDAALEHLSALTRLKTLNLGNTKVTGSGFVHLGKLKQLQGLTLYRTQVTDDGLSQLRGLTQLQGLSLQETQVTDAGLVHLSGFTQLDGLSLSTTRVTDAGLKHLSGLTRLWELGFDKTEVTGTGLAHLRGLKRLEELYLDGSKTDVAAVREFKRAVPQVRIEPWFLAWGWDDPARAANLRLTPATRKILSALGDDTRLEFIEKPLADVVAFLKDQHAVPIRLDEPRLRVADVASDAPITRNLKGITLHSALRLILAQLGLTYVICDDALVITTAEEGRRLAQQGVIMAEEVNREFEKSRPDKSANLKIASALHDDTQLHFTAAPLTKVVDFLRDQHAVPIEFDERGLAAVGVRPDVPCTLDMKGLTLAAALNKLLGDLGLTYVVEDEVILITPPKKDSPAITPAPPGAGKVSPTPNAK
jgi:beta-lactamase regulating signal transducer with metallopeptidase domain/Leucine-rich repeat (LRR) protein